MRIEKDYDLRNLPRFVFISKPLIYNAFLSPAAGDLLTWLCWKFDHRIDEKKVDRFGFFICRADEIRRAFYTKAKQPMQRQFMELSNLGIIEIKMKGQPARRHIRVSLSKLDEHISRVGRSSSANLGRSSEALLLLRSNNSKGVSKETPSRVSQNRSKNGGFFEETNGEVNEVDAKFTKKLQEALTHHGKLPRRCRPSTWLEQFRILRGDHSEEEIDQVLTWYTDHIKDKYTPHARSGRSFRSKFVQIKEAMERDQGPLLLKPISEDAQFIVNTLSNELSWPDKDQLQKCVQISYDNIQDFAIRLRRLRSSDNEEVVFFAEWWQFSESSFVEDYLRKLFYRFRRREADNWDGKLVHLAFQVDSKFLDGQFRETTRKTKRLILQELGYESGASHRK